ncbi:hypothetical protein GCM10009612_45740 [Streptomyces beijiangensis]
MAVAELEAERGVQVETGVHAGDHGDVQDRRGAHAGILEVGRVPAVRLDEPVGDRSAVTDGEVRAGRGGLCGEVRRSRHVYDGSRR